MSEDVGVSGRPAGRVCRAASARRRLTRVQQRRPQVTHSHTHTLTHTHTHSLSLTHTQALTHSSTHTLYRTLKSLFPYTNSFTDTDILSCCVTHSLTHSLTHLQTCTSFHNHVTTFSSTPLSHCHSYIHSLH